MITNNKYNVVLELEPEDVLVLTTLIGTFRTTMEVLEMPIHPDMHDRIVNILARLTSELHIALGGDN